MSIVKYIHHDKKVSVREDLKGKHRDYCLCFSCEKFSSVMEDNCKITNHIFSLDQALNVTTPVWECGSFEENK